MLWSFGLFVLIIDLWHRFKLGGIDMISREPNVTTTAADEDAKHIVVLVNNNKNLSDEPDHVHVFSASFNESKTIKPQLSFKWVDVTDLSQRIVNKTDIRQNSRGLFTPEKDLHNSATTTTPSPASKTYDDHGETLDFTLKPPFGDLYDDENNEAEDSEKVLHSNKFNRVAHPKESRVH